MVGMKRQEWEYMTVHHEVDDSELDKNGKCGWELVAVVSRPSAPLTYFFKRPLVIPPAF